ncbi:MAG: transposase [Candidatus Methanomethylophilaceae archaeon]|nr:transposase [Candidatus Methanomethylophilaceae archaeon]
MKTIKFRIEPNSEQRKVIDHMIDANRLVYNNMLTACKVHYGKTEELLSSFDLIKMGTRMRNNSSYVAQAYSMTLNETAGRVIKACDKTLGVHEKESGEFNIDNFVFSLPDHHFPRYKSYNQFNSITYPSPRDYSVVTEKKGSKKKRMLRLGKVPGLIKCYNQSTKIDGVMKTCTVKRKDMGRYYVYYACIAYEPSPISFEEPPKGPVGVDIGIHNIAALSDGTVFPNDRIFPKLKRTLEKHQRKLSRTSPGTKTYERIQTRINHLFEKISNHRKNSIENISSYIVKNHSHIVMEDLSVNELRSKSRNRFMTNGYNDASLGLLRRRIEDKASSAGREIILVNPNKTSQMCSVCEDIVDKDLSVRQHICPQCGYTVDRDVNAARNILQRSHLFQTLWVDQPPLSLGQGTEWPDIR